MATAFNEYASITARFAAHGFNLEGTGGNCTAFVRRDADSEELVVLHDDPSAPTALSDTCVVVLYDRGEEHSEPADTSLRYSCANVLAALENPSTEYTLLGLRLYNELHKGGN